MSWLLLLVWCCAVLGVGGAGESRDGGGNDCCLLTVFALGVHRCSTALLAKLCFMLHDDAGVVTIYTVFLLTSG